MNDISLYLSIRINCTYGLLKSRKSIYTEKQYILYTAVFQVIEHPQPELTGLIGAHCDT